MGEVVLTGPDGRPVTDPSFVKEAGGFTFFGDSCLEAITRSPYTVRVRVSSDVDALAFAVWLFPSHCPLPNSKYVLGCALCSCACYRPNH